MAATIVMATEQTSLILNGTAITDLIAGDFLELNPVNEQTGHINSADGGVNINHRSDRGVHDLVVRVPKFSDSDVFLNNALNQEQPVVFDGSVKEDFVKDGTDGSESYILESGSLTTRPSQTKNNTDANAQMEYTIRFRNVTRNL